MVWEVELLGAAGDGVHKQCAMLAHSLALVCTQWCQTSIITLWRQYYIIASLYIGSNPAYNISLFMYVSEYFSGSIIKQVGLVSTTISGYNHVSGLAGSCSSCTISDSYATGSVSGKGTTLRLDGGNH